MSDTLWFIEDDQSEDQDSAHMVGVDEVGRGALAGPVCVGACALSDQSEIKGLDDSKKLTTRQRNDLFDKIDEAAEAWIVLGAEAWEIDEHGMSTCLSNLMTEAVRWTLDQIEEEARLVVDGTTSVPGVSIDQRVIPGADASFGCVSAASILAKVLRDRHMVKIGLNYPGYDMQENVGYGTGNHRTGLVKNGPCEQHRHTFEPIGERTDELESADKRDKSARVSLGNPFVVSDDCLIRMYRLGSSQE